VLTGPQVILVLKIAVVAVTLLLAVSIVAVLRGHYRLHGRLNVAFFILTLSALLGLEVVARVLNPEVFDYFDERTRKALGVHLCFSLPSAGLLPVMLWTGYSGRRRVHIWLAFVFLTLWTATFVTGVFFLPHTAP